MGGRAPSYTPPTITMPKPTAPRQYRTFVPQESYQDLAELGKRLDAQTQALAEERRMEVGSSADLAELGKRRQLQEQASYFASLPGQMKDPGFMGVTMGQDERPAAQQTALPSTFQQGGMAPALEAGKEGFAAAKEAFKKAQAQKAKKDPTADQPEFDPSWAKRSDEVYAMKNLGEIK